MTRIWRVYDGMRAVGVSAVFVLIVSTGLERVFG